ncbi:MAG TPA: Gfo/Idh/MocA family oxidoreductase [Mycobacteriales bacterium]|nr:Gfo/Idh/MocA family oxidoreductase [Mycobacteriales bacterium]
MSPPEPVRWGFLGAGWIAARALAGAVRAAGGAELFAVAARDESRARALRPRRVHRSYAELLAEPAVEAVYICLANDAHCPVTVAALEAGKHVLCEKPLGLTAAEVDRMSAASTAAGRLLVEASWYRWHPRIRLAQRLLADGVLGEVRRVSAGFGFAGVPDGNYRLDPARGGGALYDVGCYAVSAALWAFGWAPVRDVVARARFGPTGVDLATEAVLTFDAGVAEVRAGLDEAAGQWIRIEGDSGRIELRDAPFTSWRHDVTELSVSSEAGTERIGVPAVDAYRLMVEDVSAAIRGGPAPLVTLAESRAVAAVLDRCRESVTGGTRV